MAAKKAGRPRIEIDEATFEDLCRIQCTQVEIAAFFRCSEDTIERWCKRHYGAKFAEVYAQKREAGHESLRRAQWRKAIEKLDTPMLIWLGKNYLGQREPSQEIAVEGDTLQQAREILNGLESVIK